MEERIYRLAKRNRSVTLLALFVVIRFLKRNFYPTVKSVIFRTVCFAGLILNIAGYKHYTGIGGQIPAHAQALAIGIDLIMVYIMIQPSDAFETGDEDGGDDDDYR